MVQLFEWLGEATKGPGGLRFIVQPAIALLIALRDGTRDARGDAKPFVFRLFFAAGERKALLDSAWKTLAVPLLVAFVIDSVLQAVITGAYRVRLSVFVGLLLVGLPYCVVRGVACRLAMLHRRRQEA